MGERKTHQKSIRLSEEVYNFVERQNGNGFNAKFENAVYKFTKEEKKLDERLREKEKHLNYLQEECKVLYNIVTSLKLINAKIKECENYIEERANIIIEE